ncbi:MAG: ABC transporter ATP-binding protein [Vicinamibacterales bacterium]
MAAVTLEGLTKVFANGHVAVRDVSLSLDDGEFLVLVGPSGCGKSTLLRLLAGLEDATSGRVCIGGLDVTGQPPQARDVAMVFQHYALYPHMSVRDNLSYGLRTRGASRETIAQRVAAVEEALGLEGLLDRRPAALSGGQRQRVALGRAMVREPQVFLFDEPLSNLDPALRARARAELQRLHRRLGTTIVHVTHDQEEAMTLGSRIAVMREGRLEQLGPPQALYDTPATAFVAGFVGSPAMNLLDTPLPGLSPPAGGLLGIRPHDLVLTDNGPLTGDVELLEPRGPDVLVHVRLREVTRQPLVMVVAADAAPAVGAPVALAVQPGRVHRFGADGRRLPA